MTDIDHPKMAGSGDVGGEEGGEAGHGHEGHVGANLAIPFRKHKRAHSRNKSITGRQDFLEEIANSEFKKPSDNPLNVDCNSNGAEHEHLSDRNCKEKEEKDMLLPLGGQDDGDVVDSFKSLPRDETDALPANLRYNWFDFFCTFISITTYIVDVVMDCIVAYYFYHLAVDHGIYHYWYFSLTLVFILVPSLTMTGFSLRWYLMDSDNAQLPKVGSSRWVLRLVVLILQLAPILRYVDSMR